MTNTEILTKAIRKAIKGGWKPFSFDIASVDYREGSLERNMIITVHASDGDIRIMYNLEAIIFNHEFCKALWGEDRVTSLVVSCIQGHETPMYDKAWWYHLREMVVADDPIKYLGENI